jgi:hypothetical protein
MVLNPLRQRTPLAPPHILTVDLRHLLGLHCTVAQGVAQTRYSTQQPLNPHLSRGVADVVCYIDCGTGNRASRSQENQLFQHISSFLLQTK